MNDFFHEELLCSLKWNQDGLLQVTPEFSSEDREFYDGDSEIFVSSENMGARRTHGLRMRKYSFSTPRGSEYEFTLEWMGRVGKWDELEDLILCRMDEEYKVISERRRRLFSKVRDRHFLTNNDNIFTHEHILQMEIISASNFHSMFADGRIFRGKKNIFVRYHIDLPDCRWSATHASFMPKGSSKMKRRFGQERTTVVHGQTRPSAPMEHPTQASDTISLYVTMAMFVVRSFHEYILNLDDILYLATRGG